MEFNTNATNIGVCEDLEKLIYLSSDFSRLDGKIPVSTVSTQVDTGEGIMDTSLRGRHELNKELLKRVGFRL